MTPFTISRARLGLCSVLLTACGGDTSGSAGSDAMSGGSTSGPSTSGGSTAVEPTTGATADSVDGTDGTTGALPGIEMQALEVAQTHVLPDGERRWTLGEHESSLHVVGGRSLLVLVDLAGPTPAEPQLEGWLAGELLGAVPLAAPAALPPTEAGGPAYSASMYSATIDAAWVRPGLALRVSAAGHEPSAERALPVGVDSDFDMWTLPFYLFGATPENTVPLAETAKPDDASATELYAKWPIARVNFRPHPAERVQWPYIIVGPRDGGPAMRVNNKDEQKDGFAVMSAVLGVLRAVREANGEAGTNNQYYAPLLMWTAGGEYGEPGGGLGGGSVGTGDYAYAGIFIHEQGHAFGMPHASDAFDAGEYPYIGGSLLGSNWGWDGARGEFLAPFIPPGADHAAECLTDGAHQLDAEGRCVKQDPMQSGSGDQAPGYKCTMFSDFNAGVIQRYFEGETKLGEGGVHEFSGGVVFVDPASSTGYSRWDSLDGRRVEVPVETVDNGLYGFDNGLPMQRDVPVHAIVLTLANAGDPAASQIYPPLSFVGNLRRQVDPTSPDERAVIVPDTGEVPWYCHASGCDYTLRVTYVDQSVRHVLIRGGFRPWFDPEGAPEASTMDPADSDSFRVFAVQVPGDQALAKIELLATPLGWTGLPADPTVLLSWP